MKKEAVKAKRLVKVEARVVRNERTSKRVAGIAGRVMERLSSAPSKSLMTALASEVPVICTVAELRALAGSCLSQAKDREEGAA